MLQVFSFSTSVKLQASKMFNSVFLQLNVLALAQRRDQFS